MRWQQLSLARAWSAAGVLAGLMVGGAAVADQPKAPLAGDTVKVLEAKKSGAIQVDLRGQGQGKVKLGLKNTTDKALNVVIPPGMVAAAATGQGGGFQNMGLGAPTNRPGAFGQFQGNNNQAGFRSVPVAATAPAVAVPAGQSVDIEVPAVCLNYGLPTPTAKDKFDLVDVDDYTRDARLRKALRSLGTLGTGLGTAQAAVWNVANNVPFEMMIAKGDKSLNRHEVALAARFVEALDASVGSDLVDPAYLTEGRIYITLKGEGSAAKDLKRITDSLEGVRVLGLPVRLTAGDALPETSAPAMHLVVNLARGMNGETRGKVGVQVANDFGPSEWLSWGSANLTEKASPELLDGVAFARALDKALAQNFVTVKTVKRGDKGLTVKIENKLPFTISHATIKSGSSAGSVAEVDTLGVGPMRSGVAVIEGTTASVDRVSVNGL